MTGEYFKKREEEKRTKRVIDIWKLDYEQKLISTYFSRSFLSLTSYPWSVVEIDMRKVD